MSIRTVREKKNGVKVVTSTYFDDIRTLNESMRDTDFQGMKHDKSCTFDTNALKLAVAVKKITLWRQGCAELSNFAENLKEGQLSHYETQYMGEEYDPNDTSLAEYMTDEEAAAFEDRKKPHITKFN